MKTVNSNKLGLRLVLLVGFAAVALAPAAQAVPPGGAQYGVGIPTPSGPRTPDGTQRAENPNLSEPAREALARLAEASPAERRELQIVGSSQQLGAPPVTRPGRDRADELRVPRADLYSRESAGFVDAASESLGATVPLLLFLLAAAAAFGAVMLRRRRNPPSHPATTAGT